MTVGSCREQKKISYRKKKAVVLPIAEWRQLMEQLEELEEIRAYDKAKSQPSELIGFQKGLRRIQSGEDV